MIGDRDVPDGWVWDSVGFFVQVLLVVVVVFSAFLVFLVVLLLLPIFLLLSVLPIAVRMEAAKKLGIGGCQTRIGPQNGRRPAAAQTLPPSSLCTSRSNIRHNQRPSALSCSRRGTCRGVSCLAVT